MTQKQTDRTSVSAGITRGGFLKGISGAAAAVISGRKAGASNLAPSGPPADVVTQQELQAAIDAWNECERTFFRIRARLEYGAKMERGRLGVSTFGHETLAETIEGGIGEGDNVELGGIHIAPAKDLTFYVELSEQHPSYMAKGITLV